MDERAQISGRLAAFVVSGLRAPLGDVQKSLCSLIAEFAEISSDFHKPDPAHAVLRFIESLLLSVAGAKGAAGALELVELLDVQAWGQGKGLKELGRLRQMSAQMLAAAFRVPATAMLGPGSSAQRTCLQLWRAATAAAIGVWPGGAASASERLQGLVGTAAAWLRLAEGNRDAGKLFEAVLGVPRIASLLVSPQANKSTPFPWAYLLRAYAQELKASSSSELREASEQKTMQSLDREYMLVYLSGNLWELHAQAGLPMEPLLVVQSMLTENVEVSMLPGAPSHSIDDPVSVQGLRQQLQQLVEPGAVSRLFGRVLCFHPRQSGNSEASTRLQAAAQSAYQRHCIAVALHEVSPTAVEALCQIYSILFVKARTAMRTGEAGWGPQIFFKIANMLAYMEEGVLVKVLWRFVSGFYDQRERDGKRAWRGAGYYHVLHVHATAFSQLLGVMSQEELRSNSGALNEQDVCDYIARTTRLVARLIWYSSPPAVAPAAAAALEMVATAPRGPVVEAILGQCGRVLTQLQTFAARGSLAEVVPTQNWLASPEILQEFKRLVDNAARVAEDGGDWDAKLVPCAQRLLRFAPQSVPFEQRLTLLRAFVQASRERANLGRPAIRLAVRRTHIFEDGLVELEKANWQARFQVIFVDEHGRTEQGQDAGGLFKEYWEKLAETAFNPEYGLFKATEARLLYPNPQAHVFHDQVARLFEFLGLVIGKAIFEGIVVEPCFVPFFLAKLLGRHNSYYDMQSLDPALFANLQRLKGYEGNVADLCCSFVATAESGEEVPLLPDGQNITVTNENRFRYIYMLSDYKLNTEQKAASAAFLKGFKRLIDERWLWMFGEDELQQVISGATTVGIDVEDLQRNTQYSNCSGPKDKLVVDFWNALKAMTPEQRSKVLRFVTSCSRTPLLGFGHLVPPFTVHKVPIYSDKEKLPTASTCFNTLKLPTYSSSKVMKQKLEFVIEQGAGFELD